MRRHTLKTSVLIGAVLLLSALCTTVVAYMFRTTEAKINLFSVATVSCEVQEATDAPVTEKTSITIKNTGNIDAYLRVRFVSYWVNADLEIVDKPSVMPEIAITDHWILGTANTYYHKKPVAPDDVTGDLLSSKISLLEEDGYQQVIEVFAEAIQSKPATAVSESWNLTLDTNGNILTAS